VARAVVAGPVAVADAGAVAAAVPEAAVAAPAPAAAGAHADAVSQACEAPQAAPRTPGRGLAWAGKGPVRRVRSEGARGGLAHQPPDRGGARRDTCPATA